jgi:hypothetical protein
MRINDVGRMEWEDKMNEVRGKKEEAKGRRFKGWKKKRR